MISDAEYFSHLFEIARSLNKEFSLYAALRNALQKTVQLLELETGWIWLMQNDKTVYLAASYNLPPALKDHPERLSGRCYCIEKYLSNNLDTATNISEITCSRLKNITTGTRNLKFHATIPIIIHSNKVGLINVVSTETQQLNTKQLAILNTISELIGIAIQRTQAHETFRNDAQQKNNSFDEVTARIILPGMTSLVQSLKQLKAEISQTSRNTDLKNIDHMLTEAEQLSAQIGLISEASDNIQHETSANRGFQYPSSPLTNREIELLTFVKKGFTNKQIADALFISERTVKFHMTSILSKLSASTRTEAIDIALKRGLIDF
jgi:two-component system, NarL family, sensor kinase